MGSAPPLLAQHDWVHVLAGYGSTVANELEVFAFIARANDDPRGFSLLAMVVSLFETGYLRTGAGLFEAFPGQLSADGMAVRLADAMRRGALSRTAVTHDIDFLAVDWFDLAELPLDDARGLFRIIPKSSASLAAGSVDGFSAGGISEFQDSPWTRGRGGSRPRLRLVRRHVAVTPRGSVAVAEPAPDHQHRGEPDDLAAEHDAHDVDRRLPRHLAVLHHVDADRPRGHTESHAAA